MSIEVKLSLAERTLNRIWQADRKRGVTFWDNQSTQFRIMQEALAEHVVDKQAAVDHFTRQNQALRDEIRHLREALTDILLRAESDEEGGFSVTVAKLAADALCKELK